MPPLITIYFLVLCLNGGQQNNSSGFYVLQVIALSITFEVFELRFPFKIISRMIALLIKAFSKSYHSY